MNYLTINTLPLKYSTYIELSGHFEFHQAVEFKKTLHTIISKGKDLYIDIKNIDNIDIIGLNSLLRAKCLTQDQGGEFYVFVNEHNPIFHLMDKIKLKHQLAFRDSFLHESSNSIAS